MNITILAYGSRGDVQPFLALAVGLKNAGHAVILAAPHRFADFIRQYDIRTAPLAGDPDVISQHINDAGGNVFRMVRGMRNYLTGIAPQVIEGARAAVQSTDLLVHSFIFTTGAHSIAREMGIPDVSVQTFPVFAPTQSFPNVALPDSQLRWWNKFSHQLATRVFWHGGNLGYRQMRRKFPAGLPARLYWPFRSIDDRPLTPLLFAYSSAICPRPADWTATNIYQPGYFFLNNSQYQPPEALYSFLESGTPPVCVTFGSMINRDSERLMQAVLASLTSTGNRGIILTGWGNRIPAETSPQVMFLDSAPHDWLFPRCKVIVHHGGAGTTAAALRSGKPNIVVPHAADQPFWGNRVAAFGAGPLPIPVKHLTTENLGAALVACESDSFRGRAADAERLIRAEDGVATAVVLIERTAAEFNRQV